MIKFFKWVDKMFQGQNYGADLEHYITSKQPQNVAEVEYWSRNYDQNRYYNDAMGSRR